MEKCKIFGTIIAIAICLSVSKGLIAQTSLLAEENFDYPVGDALTSHGWTASSGAGSNAVSVGTGSLTYTNYLPNMGNCAVLTGWGEDVYLPLSDTMFKSYDGGVTTTSGTIYAAFVLNMDTVKGNPSYAIHFCRSSSSFYAKICFKPADGGGFTVAIEPSANPGASTVWYNGNFDYHQNYLYVLKYQKIDGDFNDIFSLFINPIVGDPEPSTPTLTKIADQAEAYNVVGFALRQAASSATASNTSAFSIDGIRVATTWDDAVATATTSANTTPLPYYNDFDSIAYNDIVCTTSSGTKSIMNGWASEDVNQDGTTWFLSARNYVMYEPHSGSNSLTTSWSGSTIDDYMFTPLFHFETGQNYTLTFWKRLSSAMATTTLDIDLFSAQNSASLAQNLDASYTLTTGGWTETEIIFSPATTGDYCIGFKGYASSFAGIVGIDDLSLFEGNPPIHITALLPTPNSTDIDITSPVAAQFDHPITINNASLISVSGATGITATVDAINPNQLNIAHDNFSFNTSYTVTIAQGAIADFADTAWSFTTVNSDVELVGHSPVNNDVGIFPKQKVYIEFNQIPVVLNQSLITINNGITVSSTSINGNMLYIEHSPFAKDQNYTVTIAEGAIDRFSGVTFTFTTVHDGEIPDITHLYGPVNGIAVLRGISDNGRYLSGQSQYGAMMWDVLLNGYYPIAYGNYNSSSYGVSNDGHVALYTQASMSDMSEPKVWFESELTTLPHLGTGTGWCITPDGTKIGGYTAAAGFDATACVWNRDVNDNYVRQDYAGVPGMTMNQTRITMLSSDGSRAVGRANIQDVTQTIYEACYWNNPDTITLLNESQEYQTEYTAISGNGRYGGIWRSSINAPAIHDFETGSITILPCSSAPITAITNDKLAVSVEGSPVIGYISYVYNLNTNVCKTFANYIDSDMDATYIIDEGLKSQLLSIASSGNCRIMSISSDGKNWAIQNGAQAYMLHLQKKTDAIPENSSNTLTLYPNPAHTQITIKNIERQKGVKVEIYNLLGQLQKTSIANLQSEITIDISHLSAGVYLLKIDGVISKFVKE